MMALALAMADGDYQTSGDHFRWREARRGAMSSAYLRMHIMDRRFNHERRIKILAIVTALLMTVLVAFAIGCLDFGPLPEIHD